MKQITVDDETYALAQRRAVLKRMTISEVISDALREDVIEKPDPMSIIGCLSDEADFLDQLVEDAMRDRETIPLRLSDE